MNIPIPQFTRAEENPGFLIWQLSNLWQRNLCKALENYDLTHAQYLLLAGVYWLGKDGKPHTQTRIAKLTQTDIMMTSKVIRTLEEKGYVDRPVNQDDTRERMVEITIKGQETLAAAQYTVNKFEAHFFSSIYAAKQGFNGYLREIIKNNEL